MALERGGKIIRVHDVAQTMDALKMFEAVQTGWRNINEQEIFWH
jgi:dihydropteroate synthase